MSSGGHRCGGELQNQLAVLSEQIMRHEFGALECASQLSAARISDNKYAARTASVFVAQPLPLGEILNGNAANRTRYAVRIVSAGAVVPEVGAIKRCSIGWKFWWYPVWKGAHFWIFLPALAGERPAAGSIDDYIMLG